MPGKGKHDNYERDHEREHEHEHEREGEYPNPKGRDFPVFLKIRGARWRGSAPATAEAYARALAQWRQLPGAIGVTAADLSGSVGGGGGKDTQ